MADHRHDPASKLIQDAVDLAASAHRFQFRKGGEGVPYLVHPLRVGEILAKAGCRTDVVIAGILHDVLEDTAVGSDELRERFGAEVLALVEGASEPDKTGTWEESITDVPDIGEKR
jgi:(p)ppGpp synthase/HD superfamily hydrolase